MGRYRFLAYDLRTNTPLAELPLSGVRYGWSLNRAAEFSASLALDQATAALYTAATIPERTAVFPERDGSLMAGYIVWRRQRGAAGKVSLSGRSFESFAWRNPIRSDLHYSAVDQFAIARGIFDHLQTQPGGDIGVDTGSGTCGVTRDRIYNGWERKNVGDAIDQLAAVEGGFDWAIDVAWSAGLPAKTLTLSYPRRGRIANSTGIVFQSGKNLLDYSVDEQGDRSARSADVLGAGDATDMPIGSHTRTDLLDAGYPLTSEVASAKDVAQLDTLNLKAVAITDARASTPTFWQITVDPDDPDAGLGVWIVGDDALLEVTDINFPRQPDGTPGYRGWHRIVAATVTIDDAGAETVTVTLGPIT